MEFNVAGTDSYKVMIVGGNSGSLEISAILSGKGFRCIHFDTVEDLLRQIALSVPDAIISLLPLSSDGIREFLQIVKKSVRTRLIPMIAFGDGSQDERFRSIELGFDAYLSRGMSDKEITATVLAKLSRYREFYLLTVTDELTKLFNRRELLSRFEELIAEGVQPISLGIIDLDYFKKVNDIYGHQTGDSVLSRFSGMLSSLQSPSFIPARFGGEEFVVLMPNVLADDARSVLDDLRDKVNLLKFDTADPRMNFSISFSAGISEYPRMAGNISALLSRSDQALYAAKREGRGRNYIFRPIMARDDRFWDHFHGRSKGTFVTVSGVESVMELPFLPEALERIMRLPYNVDTIGVISLHISPLFNIVSNGGYQNHFYDLENICKLIFASCEYHLPTDMVMAIADPCDNDFMILYPSIEDFKINEAKFAKVYEAIVSDINFSLINFNVSIRSSCGVVSYDATYPRKLYSRLASVRRKNVMLTETRQTYENIFRKAAKSVKSKGAMGGEEICVDYVYTIGDSAISHSFFVLKDYHVKDGLFDIMVRDKFKQILSVEKAIASLVIAQASEISGTLLFPWIPTIGLKSYAKAVAEASNGIPVCLCIEEAHLSKIDPVTLSALRSGFPDKIGLCISNCFIGPDLLNYLSIVDVSAVIFSPNLVRNIHLYRDRVKVMIGITQFADQIGVPSIAMGVSSREEYQLILSTGIFHASGHYLHSMAQKK
jgi:diguanylate cyclase (GGDEF)-like protein